MQAEGRIYCEKLKCDLSRECCKRRQEIATRYEFGRMGTGKFEECVDCEQGTTIRGGKKMGNIELKCMVEGVSYERRYPAVLYAARAGAILD